MFIAILTLISALSISAVAIYYSVAGLAAIFAAAVVPIIIMGVVLEVGKLVTAVWLHRNWNNAVWWLKSYLIVALIVLMFITSMGIFGFLSKAHLDSVQPQANFTIKTELIDKQIANEQKIIDRAENTLDQLDKALDKYIDMEYVTRGLKERDKQADEREALQIAINNAIAKISELQIQKSTIELDQQKIEAEVGPLKYIAELIYGDNAKDHFDEAVRYAIMVLIFVFDPLAVLLLIAANISLRTYNERKEEKAKKVQKDYQREATNAKARAKGLRDRQKVYQDFFKKLGKNDLKNRDYEKFFKEFGTKDLMALGLDPDEIRIKLDQIMQWNEMDTSKNKPNKRYLEVDNITEK